MKQKTRAQSVNVSDCNYDQYYQSTGALYYQAHPYYPGFSYDADIESIDYENANRKRFTNCLHLRRRSSIPLIDCSDIYSGWKNVYHNGLTYQLVMATEPTVPHYDVSEAPVQLDWQALSYAAWESMRPQIESATNLLTFLHELKDLKKLPDLWSQKRPLLKNAANLHLNYSFGWAPFLADVWNLYSTLKGVNHALDVFLQAAGKPQKRHYKRVLKGSPLDTVILQRNIGAAVRSIRVERQTSDITFCATMSYQYSVGGGPELLKQVRGWLDAFGVNLNPQVIWDAIPFSFVVDWFFNIGQELNALKLELLPAVTYITDYCHSAKYKQTRSVYFTCSTGDYLVYQTNWEVYNRIRTIPSTTPGIHFTGPGLSQLLLAGSLTTVLTGKK